ncbi:MAG: amino acid permease [Cyclobacteriaceae bacterium]
MAKKNKFGTFGGVFVPSILTILGVIMYLRLPMIVGEAGLWATIGIIVVAHIISFTTGLSVSSIATDKKVEAGGTYYMISRSLGLPIGGTLGIALFVGLSFSVSLYLIGFSESFLNYWGFPTDINNIRLTGSILLLAVTTLTFISTSLAIKTQYFIMAAIALSLVSIIFGSHELAPETPVFTNSSSTIPLMVLFGIFFPAVTGFEAGVSMSGDLKDPKRSIPTGSIMAIVVGFVVYIAMAVFLTLTVSGEALATDPNVLLKMAWVPELVIAGIWGATLSSALGSILGAPRILQATAVDKITPKVFAKGYGATNEPRNALLLTFLIAEAGILIGELDVIARVVSIFFITTYGFLNISATFERWTSTDFRPEFKVPGWISVLGAAACILVMIQLDFVAMLGAVAILGLLFLYLKRKELTLDSGDAWSGVWATLVKTGLTNLKRDKLHKRNWRPNTIMFCGSSDTRRYMQDMGKAISGKFGILSAFELLVSDDKVLNKSESNLSDEKESGYFRHRYYCSDVYSGMDQVSRLFGFSGVEPNTILMGWSKTEANRENFRELLKGFGHNRYNTVFLKYDLNRKYGSNSTIDIWWSGAGRNLAFAINLIRPLAHSQLWKHAKIRLLIINPNNEEAENLYKATTAILANYRTEAEIRIVNNEVDPLQEKDIIAEESKDTDLVILGIPDQKYYQLDKYHEGIDAILNGLGSTLLIHASDDFEELEVMSAAKPKAAALLDDMEEAAMQLPPLTYSKYPEVATDIRKIDVNGCKVLELFHKKAFQAVFADRMTVLGELGDRIRYIQKDLKKTAEFSDNYRKKKAIDKLKNEIFFKINSLFSSELKEKMLPEQLDRISEAISWYQNRLTDEYRKYPRTLEVSYQEQDFAISPNDSLSVSWFKRTKKAKHWFVGQPITNKVHYREVARHYQIDNRQVFLQHFLVRFQEEEMSFYHDLRKITNAIFSYLDETERKIWQESKDWSDQSALDKIIGMIEDDTRSQQRLNALYENRLQLEFRKNLQQMNDSLGKIDVNRQIRNLVRPSKYYKGIVADIQQLPEEGQAKVHALLNLILMELSINATKNRIEELHELFGEKLKHVVKQKYLRELDLLAEKMSKNEGDINLEKHKLDQDFETELQQSFNENLERMIALTETMPETLEIYSTKNGQEDNQEAVSVSVASMAEYYLKSKYEVAVEQQFDNVLDTIKRSVYATKDLLNLTQFNLENVASENNGTTTKEILRECTIRLEKEKKTVEEKVEGYIAYADEHFEKAFEPLSSMKIEESADEFLSGLRNYQGQQVLSGVSYVTEEVRKIFRDSITRLFYSRSEGILLAKKLGKAEGLSSYNSRLLDLHEKVNPSPDVLKALPQYYITMFNGKSSISKDFWINRSFDEKTFRKAVKRHQQGYGGGILLLGERNSGKTAFSKYVANRFLKKKQAFSVFPPIQGTITVEGFSEAFRKATQKFGDTTQILSQLPEGSVVIVNDLELFWEKGEHGLAVVHHLEHLIDEYGQKVLFVVNMNPHAYKSINQLTGFGDRFIEIINFMPFDAEELKDLVMSRHRSSGLSIRYDAEGDQLSELQLAQLFNGYFNYSDGSPGTALNCWLTNIRKATGKELLIQKPVNPSIAVFKELSEEWSTALTQFVMHKRLSAEKLQRITGWEMSRAQSMVRAMLRSGVILEKASGIYHVDPYLQPFLVKALKENEVLS